MAPNLDLEIDLLMAKLDTIQTDVGVPKEGKSKDGKDGGGKAGPARTGDRFLDLKAVMIGKLREIRTVMTEQQEAKSGGAANPKQTIEQDTKARGWLGGGSARDEGGARAQGEAATGEAHGGGEGAG